MDIFFMFPSNAHWNIASINWTTKLCICQMDTENSASVKSWNQMNTEVVFPFNGDQKMCFRDMEQKSSFSQMDF